MDMSSKPQKKTSFWKKIGLGKTKSSISSIKSEMQRQDHFDSSKTKRFSSASVNQLKPTEKQRELIPPLPAQSIPPHHVKTPVKVLDHVKQPTPSSKPAAASPPPPPPPPPPLSLPSTPEPTLNKSEPSPSRSQSQPHSLSETTSEKQSASTQQPSPLDTPSILSPPTDIPNETNLDVAETTLNVTSSSVTTDKNLSTSDDINKTEEVLSSSYIIVSETKQELLSKVADLQAELESEKATVVALQKQKEAVTKDLDYLEMTVEELYTEKTDLLQQLEDEKIKSQHHLDDLNILLDKMKSNADHARDQSLAVSKSKQEFEAFQKKTKEEKQALSNQLEQRDQTIHELEIKLIQSQEQVEFSKETMNQLVKTHTAEIGQLTTQLQLVQKQLAEQQELMAKQQQQMIQQQQQYQAEYEKLLHTPNGSPRIQPEQEKHLNPPQPMSRTNSSDAYRTPRESMEQLDKDDLDDQLLKLTQAREKLQSAYSKIPINGGGVQVRRRQEELEMMLDQVDSQLSKVKQKIRKA